MASRFLLSLKYYSSSVAFQKYIQGIFNMSTGTVTFQHSKQQHCSIVTTAPLKSPTPLSPVVTKDSYEEAIRQLNNLQSNASTLKNWVDDQQKITKESVLLDTQRFLERGGVSLTQLDKLNVIHVAGTKGKGTTCAFVESILRHAGLRTGFFSSPHLVEVRERIRINGIPLSKEKFSKYFFHVFRNMESGKETDKDMPAYFRFLTCMGFHAFIQEEVDVVVLEVGIGGALDSTNCIRKPVATGIMSLGLEHQRVLGETLEDITRAKAGIMKPEVPCFTVPTHPLHISEILKEEAALVRCPLFLTPPLESYGKVPVLGVDDGRVSRLNASVAVQLSTAFLQQKFPKLVEEVQYEPGRPFELLPFHLEGLRTCTWAGRFQILRRNPRLTYFLDGAHTDDSLAAARAWFTQRVEQKHFKVLVFTVTGDRKASELLTPFAKSGEYGLALFCPLVTTNPSSADNWSALRDETELMRTPNHLSTQWQKLCPDGESEVLGTVNHVLDRLDRISASLETSVLITGSLHLVGQFLSVLGPN